MSKLTSAKLPKKATVKNTPFQVKKVTAGMIASIVLEELSRDYADVCNFLEASRLASAGELFLALTSVLDSKESRAQTVASARRTWAYAQAEAVLKKCIDPNYDAWPETAKTWFRTEQRCARLNQKFEALTNRRATGKKPVPFGRELYRFYEALCYVLGDSVPVLDIAEHAYYGPGSSIGVRGQDVNFVRKVENNECVPLAVDIAAQALLHDKAAWAHFGMDPTFSHVESAREGFLRVAREQLSMSVVRHDRLMFIFKSMTSHRSICAQPTCSGMVQLGVHVHMTRLLAERAGIDLSDQSRNQDLAAKGSRDWEATDPWCTLDKSNASNLIANGLVQYLFPPAWARFLQRIRTPGYEAPKELGGGHYDYHMYAGMGNGTTFCVETLIFWAATFATQELPIEEYVQRRPYAVYGDDVILRRGHAYRYIEFARYLGFRFNEKKTFLTGPFRESCGSDFYDGIPVRPATLESEDGFVRLPDAISFHNVLADNKVFPLVRACARIRALAKTHLYPLLPTDPAGNLGFRPMGDTAHYSIVRGKDGRPLRSEFWQRPRTYVLEVKPKFASLGPLDRWTEMAVALLHARQSGPQGLFSLPVRSLVNYRVVAETDMVRKDLVRMVTNQLKRLAVRKSQPWWKNHRG